MIERKGYLDNHAKERAELVAGGGFLLLGIESGTSIH